MARKLAAGFMLYAVLTPWVPAAAQDASQQEEQTAPACPAGQVRARRRAGAVGLPPCVAMPPGLAPPPVNKDLPATPLDQKTCDGLLKAAESCPTIDASCRDASLAAKRRECDTAHQKLKTACPGQARSAHLWTLTCAENPPAETPKPSQDREKCEDLENQAKRCQQGTGCGEDGGMNCLDIKETWKSLVQCQKAAKELKEKCPAPASQEGYQEITRKAQHCAELITENCCQSWTDELQRQKDEFCGTDSCSGNDDCDDLFSKLANFRRCLDLRKLETELCFDGMSDEGHAEQTDVRVPSRIAKCLALIASAPQRLKKTCEPSGAQQPPPNP